MLSRAALLVATSTLRAPRCPLQLVRLSSCAPPVHPATDALYLRDSGVLQAHATVLGVEHNDKGWLVVLDATPFHPQGGGQPADIGTINDAAVLGCFAEGRAGSGGIIFHALDTEPPFATGEKVVCQVEGGRRQRSARVHSAGHLIDAAMQRCGVHLVAGKGYHFPDGAYVEYLDPPETRMSPEEREELIPRLQTALDELIVEDSPTEISAEEDGTRIVTIGGLPCPCGGTHVTSASSIGAVTVTALKSKGSGKKKALRVSYSVSD